MRLLGIETSCDETSAAIVEDERILSNIVSTQVALHAPHGGVVPEIAARQHLQIIDAVIDRAIHAAGVASATLDAVAVTRGPGLPSALLVGVSAARGLALRLGKPLLPIHHMEAHLYSVKLEPAPFVALIVSGGHTILVHGLRPGEHRILGQTLDDAAGEAFDKAAQLLGLGYPGGPQIERQARQGNPRAWDFPRPMLESGDWNFSFSGLKTALRRTVSQLHPTQSVKNTPATEGGPAAPAALPQTADLCASFQAAVVDVLVGKTIRAALSRRVSQITVSGGVACNGRLREEFQRRCAERGLRLAFAGRALCTDNAAMIALLAVQKLKGGYSPPAGWDIAPDWSLGSAA